MEEKEYSFSYSATDASKRREEIEQIRLRYVDNSKADDNVTRLKKLDQKAKSPAMCISLSLGIIGVLIFGGGMSMALSFGMILLGSIIGLVGLVVLSAAYPTYQLLLRKGKKKYAAEILRLSEELLKE